MSKGSWKPKMASLERPVTRGELHAGLHYLTVQRAEREDSLDEEVLDKHFLDLVRSRRLGDMSTPHSPTIQWTELTQTRPTVAPLMKPCLHLFHAGTLSFGSLRSL